MQTEILFVTPEVASKWLESRSEDQRRVSDIHVTFLAREIEEGRWELNGDAIRFDDSGRLVDGQHRLEAVVRANKGIKTLVVRNLSHTAMAVIDTGKRRNISDFLRVRGVREGDRVGPVIRGMWSVLHAMEEVQERTPPRNSALFLDVVKSFPEIYDGLGLVDEYESVLLRAVGLRPAIAVAVYALCAVAGGRAPATTYIHRLITGEDLRKDDAIRVARMRLALSIQSPRGPQRITPIQQVPFLVKAWNGWVNGRDVRSIKNTSLTIEPLNSYATESELAQHRWMTPHRREQFGKAGRL